MAAFSETDKQLFYKWYFTAMQRAGMVYGKVCKDAGTVGKIYTNNNGNITVAFRPANSVSHNAIASVEVKPVGALLHNTEAADMMKLIDYVVTNFTSYANEWKGFGTYEKLIKNPNGIIDGFTNAGIICPSNEAISFVDEIYTEPYLHGKWLPIARRTAGHRGDFIYESPKQKLEPLIPFENFGKKPSQPRIGIKR